MHIPINRCYHQDALGNVSDSVGFRCNMSVSDENRLKTMKNEGRGAGHPIFTLHTARENTGIRRLFQCSSTCIRFGEPDRIPIVLDDGVGCQHPELSSYLEAVRVVYELLDFMLIHHALHRFQVEGSLMLHHSLHQDLPFDHERQKMIVRGHDDPVHSRIRKEGQHRVHGDCQNKVGAVVPILRRCRFDLVCELRRLIYLGHGSGQLPGFRIYL